MGTLKRASAEHRAEVLRRERELAPELFRRHSDEEMRAVALELDRLDRARSASRREAMLPHPQLQLAISL